MIYPLILGVFMYPRIFLLVVSSNIKYLRDDARNFLEAQQMLQSTSLVDHISCILNLMRVLIVD